MTQPLLAIVILNYNGRAFLQKFLPSVLQSTYTNKRVIVADNASTDDSLTFLSNNFPRVDVIENDKNYGFAQGYNQALQGVVADYYVLLNSDVEVTPGWIEPVISLMQADEKIAVCQPKILSYEQKHMFEYAGAGGGLLDMLGYPLARGRIFDTLENDYGQYNDIADVFWASGCAMFVKAAVYKELGGLYAYFFAHQEEIDFCWRAQRAGYRIVYCGNSHVYHVGGGTLPKGNYKKTYLNFRNNLIMLARNLKSGEKFWKLFIRLSLDGVFALRAFFSGDIQSVWAVFMAHMHFYAWCFMVKKQKKLPKMPFKNLSGNVNTSIVWQYFVQGKKHYKEIKSL